GEEVRRTQGVEVQVRVGVNSGGVVVRSIGSDLRVDYTAVGQTTHVAARMEQLALPGTIRITAETLRLAEGFVEVKPPRPRRSLARGRARWPPEPKPRRSDMRPGRPPSGLL